MRGKPSVVEFISGAQADKAERPAVVKEPKPIVAVQTQRAQRSVRLPIDLCTAIRDRAYEQSKETGIRVTEQDIFEQALRKFLK